MADSLRAWGNTDRAHSQTECFIQGMVNHIPEYYNTLIWKDKWCNSTIINLTIMVGSSMAWDSFLSAIILTNQIWFPVTHCFPGHPTDNLLSKNKTYINELMRNIQFLKKSNLTVTTHNIKHLIELNWHEWIVVVIVFD